MSQTRTISTDHRAIEWLDSSMEWAMDHGCFTGTQHRGEEIRNMMQFLKATGLYNYLI